MGGGSSRSSYQQTIKEYLRTKGAAMLPLPNGAQLVAECEMTPCHGGIHAIRLMPNVVIANLQMQLSLPALFCQGCLTQYIGGVEICGDLCTNPSCSSAQLAPEDPNRFRCYHVWGHNTRLTPHACINCPEYAKSIGYVRMNDQQVFNDTVDRSIESNRMGQRFIEGGEQMIQLNGMIAQMGQGNIDTEEIFRQINLITTNRVARPDLAIATFPFTELFLMIRSYDLSSEQVTTTTIHETRKRRWFSSSYSRTQRIEVISRASERDVEMIVPINLVGDRVHLIVDRAIFDSKFRNVVDRSGQVVLYNERYTIEEPAGYAPIISNFRENFVCERGKHQGAIVPVPVILYQFYQRIFEINGSVQDFITNELQAKVSLICCIKCGLCTCLLYRSTILANLEGQIYRQNLTGNLSLRLT